MGSDFIVESNGHCFICLKKTDLLQKRFVKDDEGAVDVPPLQIHSLRSLSRCLKMNMAKVFNRKEPIPQYLFDQVQQSELKVELCEACAVLNEKVFGLCRHLERIEMELVSSLTVIHEEISKSEEIIRNGKGLMIDASSDNSNVDWKGKLEILETLRKETMQKCSGKLGGRPPRIRVKNLTMKEVTKEMLKFKGSASVGVDSGGKNTPSEFYDDDDDARQQFSLTDVKEEILDSPFPPEEDDTADDYNDDGSEMTSEEDIFKDDANRNQEGEASRGNLTVSENSHSISVESSPQERRYIFNPHTGKFKCTVCSKELTDKSNVFRHYKSIHQKVKYKCSLCKKEFTLLASYKRHHEQVHLGVRVNCTVCNKTFYDKNVFRKHLKQSGCRGQISRQ